MKFDRKKLDIAMARACKSRNDLVAAGIKPTKISQACTVDMRPSTAGKIAKAIGCDITELLADEYL